MSEKTYYFFAELSFDLAIWFGLARIIRDLKPGARLELICSLDKRIENYDIESLIKIYDCVHHIRGASLYSYGNWRRGLTTRNIYSAISKTFPDARKTYQDLKQISFVPYSIAFVHGCHNINQWMFLKRIKSASKVISTFFLSTDSPYDNELFKSDWFINRSQSAYLNFHTQFFGTENLDVYWIKTPESIVTNHRHFVFRDKPADFVFWPVVPLRFNTLQNDQIYLPLPFLNKSRNKLSVGTVLFVGGKYHWLQGLPREAETIFYKKLNSLIKLIRKKHNGQRMLHKPHPSQNQTDLKKLDLTGFEIESSISSEALFLNDSSLQTVYSFSSTSVQTAASMGIQSFYLYNLFNLNALGLPKAVQRNWSDRYCSEVHPQMNIRSIEDWMDGKNDYIPQNMSQKIFDSTKKILDIIDVK